MKSKLRNAIAAAAILALMSGAVASAQTATTTSGQTTTGSSTTPGVPNTGLGGDALSNWLLLSVTGLIALGGIAFLARRPTETDSQ